jgi:hypothetical protein
MAVVGGIRSSLIVIITTRDEEASHVATAGSSSEIGTRTRTTKTATIESESLATHAARALASRSNGRRRPATATPQEEAQNVGTNIID